MSRALQHSPSEVESGEKLDIVKESDYFNRSRGREKEEDSIELPDLPRYSPRVKDKEEITETDQTEIQTQAILPVSSPKPSSIVKETEEVGKIDTTEIPTPASLPVYSPEEAPDIEDPDKDLRETTPSKELLPLYSPEKAPNIEDAETRETTPAQELLPLYSPEQAPTPSVEDPQEEINLTTEPVPIYFNDRVSIILQN